MKTVPRSGCEVARKLTTIEDRLRKKVNGAKTLLCSAGYAQASLEIAREGLAHFRECPICQVAEEPEAA